MVKNSYLNKLQFRKDYWGTWYAKYLVQIRLVILLIISIVAVGMSAYFSIPRRLNPQVNIPIVIVTTVLPGASPEDVEQLVTIPLEDQIKSVKDIDTLTSTSQNGVSSITIQFLSKVNKEKARSDVQSAVDSATKVSEDAKNPSVIALDFENQPIWTFAVTGPTDPASLKRFANLLKKRIEEDSRIGQVVTSGLDEQDVEVTINPERVSEFGITPIQLSQTIQSLSSAYPAGDVQTGLSSFALSIDRDILSIEDIRNIQISVSDQPILLGDIATVTYISKENQATTLYTTKEENIKPVIEFFVYRAENSNIDTSAKAAQDIVEKTKKEYQDRFSIITVENTAEEITKQFSDLTRDFFITVLLVFGLLLIFLGFKQAAIASITVPLTFLSTFAIINALGLSLNFLTAFALLIALGLLIDDTIVTVAAMTRYYATGKFSPAETGILVWKDFIVPLWSTTIATIWAFLPLLIASGIIGEFIKSIPIVVTATMVSSTSIAVLITLPLMIFFLKPTFPKRVKILFLVLLIAVIMGSAFLVLPKNFLTPFMMLAFGLIFLLGFRKRELIRENALDFVNKNKYLKPLPNLLYKLSNKGLLDIEWLSKRYMVLIERILNSKHGMRLTLIALAIFAFAGYLLIPTGLVQNEFFPKQDTNILYINLSLPSGTNSTVTKGEMVNVLEKVRNMNEVNFVIGESGHSFSGDFGRSNDSSSALITLHLTDIKERQITSGEIAEEIRKEFKSYSRGKLTVVELSGGPPAGADLQITLLGEDLSELEKYADQIVLFLQKQTGIVSTDKSIKPGTSKIAFVPDKEKLVANNLTVDSIALWLRTYASGFTLNTIKFGSDEQTIIFKLDSDTRSPEDLSAINIITPQGEPIPLISLGKFILTPNPTIITREEGKHTLAITAAVGKGVNIPEKNKDLENFVTSLNLPAGYTWKTGGVNEENQKSVNSIFQAMIISVLLILITMVVEFRSFRQTLIALLIIPMSVAGVLYIFALTLTPLSFPALIGVLSLFGIVVTHAIVVIEKINDNLREKLPLKEAIIDAAGSRLEPVMLTSLATILGLIPITISDPLWRGLGGAIIAGLIFSGAIKLFFVPVMYYLMFKGKK